MIPGDIHNQRCADCGKCRATENEEWCGECGCWSCERGPDCANDASGTTQVIPCAALEAAAAELWPGGTKEQHRLRQVHAALEAAAPHMLSHEREETRLAHIDAMVNRETKQSELAKAWDAGHERGFWNGRMSQLTRPHDAPAPDIGAADAEAKNPYR